MRGAKYLYIVHRSGTAHFFTMVVRVIPEWEV